MTNTKTIDLSGPDHSLLERNKLFRNISFGTIEHALKDCQVISLKSGSTLLEIGQKNTSLYLVLDGELRVYLDDRDMHVHTALGTGECVGELSLIDGGHTAALVIAARDTRVLAIPHDLVWSLVESSNGIARNLLSILAGRIRSDNLLQVMTPDSTLEFETASHVDTLTGLHNRSWMDEAFHRMALRCKHNGMPLFLMVADIDHFKDLVDRHGYLAGDAILKGAGRIMAINLRPHDLFAYLGGDRFAILLPERSSDMALKAANRLREAVAAPTLHVGASNAPHPASDSHATQEEHVTISLGVVAVQPDDTLASALRAVNEALLQAKADGRNQVKMATVRN